MKIMRGIIALLMVEMADRSLSKLEASRGEGDMLIFYSGLEGWDFKEQKDRLVLVKGSNESRLLEKAALISTTNERPQG